MIIVDACVAVKLFIAETDSQAAEQLFRTESPLVAPDLILVEVGSALYKAWRNGIIDADHMDRALRRLPTLFGRLFPLADLVADAAVISRILRHPLPDCVYAALHWRIGVPVVTADEAFIKAISAFSIWQDTTRRLKDFDQT